MKQTAILWGNGIGNFVLATPFFQNLDNPTIFIPKDDPRREAIESISPYPVEVFEYQKSWEMFDKVYQMWCAPKINAPNRIRQPKPNLSNWTHGHEIDYNLSLLNNPIKYHTRIVTEGGWKIHTAPGEKLVGIVNGANPSWLNKKVSDYRIKEIVEALIQAGYIVVFFGGGDEKKLGMLLEKQQHILSFAGRLSLSATIDTMKQCDILITNDSGLMHCADSYDMDMICLWGSTIWEKNRPTGAGKITKVEGLGCPHAPCYGKPIMHACPKHLCMDISVSKIMEVL